jgi:hypothetical protein
MPLKVIDTLGNATPAPFGNTAKGGVYSITIASSTATAEQKAAATPAYTCVGVADDVVINAAAIAARALWDGDHSAYPTLYFTPGVYNITDKCDLTRLSVIMDGKIVVPITYHGIAMEVGHVYSVSGYDCLAGVKLRLACSRASNTGAIAGDIGIVAYNLYYSNMEIVECDSFYDNVVCDGHGCGFAYNTVILGAIGSFLHYGLILTCHNHVASGGDTAGWCNENNWIGGDYHGSAGSTAAILITSENTANYYNNNNVFRKPSLEGSPTYGIDIQYGIYNTVLEARVEGPTNVAHFANASIVNTVDVGYTSSTAALPVVDDSTSGGNIVRRTYLGMRSLVPVVQLDFSRAFVDSSGYTHIPGAEIRKSTDAVSYSSADGIRVMEYTNTGLTGGQGGNYIYCSSGRAVGIMVDTSQVKQFVVRPDFYDLDGSYKGRPLIICYDVDGVQLTGTTPYYCVFNDEAYSTGYGGSYRYGADSAKVPTITFHADVASAFIGWGLGTAGVQMAGLSIYTFADNDPRSEQCRTWLRYNGLKQNYPDRYSPAVPTVGGYNGLLWEVGDKVWHSDAGATDVLGWQCVFTLRTTLDGAEATGQTTLSVTSTTGIAIGDKVGIMLDSGVMQWSSVVSFVAGDTITVADALTGDAANGNAVVFFRFEDMPYLKKGNRQYARAYTKLDLSGAAQTNIPVLHTSVACTLVKAILLYTEASSGDAGITVTVGKETDNDYYYTGTSEVSKAVWYEKELTLLQTDIAAGDTVVCGHAGSKTGTGEVLVCIEYYVN